MAALGAMLIAPCALGGGELRRRVVLVGDQPYLITQQEFPVSECCAGEVWLTARHGKCAGAYIYSRPPEPRVLLRQFDTWAQPEHETIHVDPDLSRGAEWTAATRFGDRTWVTWAWAGPDRRNTCARMFAHNGDPVGSTILITDAVAIDYPDLSIDTDGATVALAMEGALYDSPGTRGVFLRTYDFDGEPTSGLVLAASGTLSFETPMITILPDGSLGLTYQHGNPTLQDWRIWFRRINPDLSMEPRVLLAGPTAWPDHVCAQADGSFLLFYATGRTGSQYFVRRFNAYGQPVGEPHELPPDVNGVDCADDGRFALAFWTYPERRVLVQLYGADWRSLGAAFDFTIDPTLPNHDFSIAFRRNTEYDENGAVWIEWRSSDGRGGTASYLSQLKPFQPGDLNADGVVNNFDIDPFVLALTDPETYQRQFPGVPYAQFGDVNFDGRFDNFDIDPFVELLWGP